MPPRRPLHGENSNGSDPVFARGGVNMCKYLLALLRDEAGLTMVEYAVAGSLITLACVTAFTNLGTAVASKISDIVSRAL